MNPSKLEILEAPKTGNLNKVKLLIENGADIETVDFLGYTPLIVACFFGKMNIVKYLVEHGANMEAKTLGFSSTCLLTACKMGYIDIVKYLIDHGANINALDKNNDSCLILACEIGYTNIVEYLLDLDINIFATNKNNQTAYSIAYGPFIQQLFHKKIFPKYIEMSQYDHIFRATNITLKHDEIIPKSLNEICIICLEQMDCMSNCKHNYCKQCLYLLYFECKNKLCALCRQELGNVIYID